LIDAKETGNAACNPANCRAKGACRCCFTHFSNAPPSVRPNTKRRERIIGEQFFAFVIVFLQFPIVAFAFCYFSKRRFIACNVRHRWLARKFTFHSSPPCSAPRAAPPGTPCA
jgi:hypothetical protein